LVAASGSGHTKIVQMLVTAGARVNGESGLALRCASARGHEEVVRVLIKAGARVDLKGDCEETALQAASRLGYTKIVQILITAGTRAQVNMKYEYALWHASFGGHAGVVHALIKAGAPAVTEAERIILDSSLSATG
jgi:ankyrin repeat domain-containing protein 50